MSDLLNPPPSFASRLFAGLFGTVLGLSTLVCASLVAFMIFGLGEQVEGDGFMLVLSVGMFAPMTLVLAGATSSTFVFVFTGRRGPLIHQGSLKILTLVLGILFSVLFVGRILTRDWSGAFEAVCMGFEMVVLFGAGVALDRPSESVEQR